MVINITEQDADEGNNSKDACPITIALRRKFGKDVSVARSFIRKKNKSGEIILVPLPKKAQGYLLDILGPFKKKTFSFNLSASAVKKLRG